LDVDLCLVEPNCKSEVLPLLPDLSVLAPATPLTSLSLTFEFLLPNCGLASLDADVPRAALAVALPVETADFSPSLGGVSPGLVDVLPVFSLEVTPPKFLEDALPLVDPVLVSPDFATPPAAVDFYKPVDVLPRAFLVLAAAGSLPAPILDFGASTPAFFYSSLFSLSCFYFSSRVYLFSTVALPTVGFASPDLVGALKPADFGSDGGANLDFVGAAKPVLDGDDFIVFSAS